MARIVGQLVATCVDANEQAQLFAYCLNRAQTVGDLSEVSQATSSDATPVLTVTTTWTDTFSLPTS